MNFVPVIPVTAEHNFLACSEVAHGLAFGFDVDDSFAFTI